MRNQKLILISLAFIVSGCLKNAVPESFSLNSASPFSISISNPPDAYTNQSSLNFTVAAGAYVTRYKYKFGSSNIDCHDGANWSSEFDVTSNPFINVNLSSGDIAYRFCIIGGDAENWMSEQSAMEYNFSLDSASPTAFTASIPSPNNLTTVSLSVSATDTMSQGASYRYKLGISSNCADFTDYSNEIPLTMPINQSLGSSGNYILCLIAKDNAGNWQSAPTIESWDLDLIPPVVTATGQPFGANNLTSIAATVTGADVQFYRYKLGLAPMNCSNSSGYSSAIDIGDNNIISDPLGADGIYELCMVGADSLENWQPFSSPTTYSWTKDTTVPIASISGQPTNPSNATVLNIAVSGMGVIEYRYKWGLSADCSDPAGYSGTISVSTNITDTLSVDGTYDLCVIGSNGITPQPYASATQYTWIKDTTPPHALLLGAPSSPNNVNALDVTVYGTDVTHYRYKVGDAPQDCSSAAGYGAEFDVSMHITASLGGDGNKQLCVIGRDAASNYEPFTSASTHTWIKDTVAPIANLSNVPPAMTNQATLNIVVSGADLSFYKYKIGATSLDCSVIAGYSTDVPAGTNITDIMPEGTYKLCVIGRDNANNYQAYTSASIHTWTYHLPKTIGLLYESGEIENASFAMFSNSFHDPRNMCYFKTDPEQAVGLEQGIAREGGFLGQNSGATLTTITANLDPRIVSMARKPDTGELWALLSYGKIVRVTNAGTIDFAAACPFYNGCDGYERFNSLSVGYGDALYLLDHQGQLFNNRDFSSPVATYSERVKQVSYY